ncbi:MAG: Crp/Fnr family transcriptional regulator [Bacteroidota bacterium]
MKIEHYINRMKDCMNEISTIDSFCFSDITTELTYETLEKNEFYSREGAYAKKLSFVCEGALRIFHANAKGEEWNKHFIIEHDFFSANSNIEAPSIVSIQAITPVRMLSVPLRYIHDLYSTHNQLNIFIQKLITLTLEKEQQRGLMLMSLDATQKYAFFSQTFPGLEKRIPHYYIASYLGITPTQLSRIRKKIAFHQQM